MDWCKAGEAVNPTLRWWWREWEKKHKNELTLAHSHMHARACGRREQEGHVNATKTRAHTYHCHSVATNRLLRRRQRRRWLNGWMGLAYSKTDEPNEVDERDCERDIMTRGNVIIIFSSRRDDIVCLLRQTILIVLMACVRCAHGKSCRFSLMCLCTHTVARVHNIRWVGCMRMCVRSALSRSCSLMREMHGMKRGNTFGRSLSVMQLHAHVHTQTHQCARRESKMCLLFGRESSYEYVGDIVYASPQWRFVGFIHIYR